MIVDCNLYHTPGYEFVQVRLTGNALSILWELTEVEQHPNGKLVYIVPVQSAEGRREFPIAAQNVGSAAQNEAVVLRSTLRFAEELTESLRLRLG